jgi:ribonuclease M5
MKKVIDALIVVEGKTDVAFLSNFIESEFIITNGSSVPRETIEYIKECKRKKEVIVLTDPDSPGKKIRDTLDREIPDLKHAFVNKSECIKNGKVGVAESNYSEVLRALSSLVINKKTPTGNLTPSKLFELDLMGSENSSRNRDLICQKFSLGFANGKTLLKRLNNMNISEQEIVEALK